MTTTDLTLLITVGDATGTSGAPRTLALSAGLLTPEERAEELASLLTPPDLRSRAAVLVSDDLAVTASVYAALVGFAARRLDLADTDTAVRAERTELRLELAWLEEIPEEATFELSSLRSPLAPRRDDDEDSAAGLITAEEAARLALSRRLSVTADGLPTLDALLRLLRVASLRARTGTERLPLLAAGEQTIDLESYRRAGNEVRRRFTVRTDRPLAEAVEPSDRLGRLQAAASVPMPTVLGALGVVQAETGRWHCPRPDRHRNGDRTASAKLNTQGRFQCLRCDAEPVDPLRLVADCLGVGPDEAATWLELVRN
jgi:hypothetical protein